MPAAGDLDVGNGEHARRREPAQAGGAGARETADEKAARGDARDAAPSAPRAAPRNGLAQLGAEIARVVAVVGRNRDRRIHAPLRSLEEASLQTMTSSSSVTPACEATDVRSRSMSRRMS